MLEQRNPTLIEKGREDGTRDDRLKRCHETKRKKGGERKEETLKRVKRFLDVHGWP